MAENNSESMNEVCSTEVHHIKIPPLTVLTTYSYRFRYRSWRQVASQKAIADSRAFFLLAYFILL